ncbi:MAG: tetratricopeptide repeat protein [bacterium]|nr:tetratricopeptide repeat protein [bacterium]
MKWLGLAVLLLALAPDVVRADPQCAKSCRALAEKGELKQSVGLQGCIVRVCQEDGRRLYRDAKHEEALKTLDFVGEWLAPSAAYQLDLGLVYYALGRFDDALKSFDLVTKLFPDGLRGGSQRAFALLRLQRFAEAQEQFEKMLEAPAAKHEFRGLKTESYLRGYIGATQLMRDNPKEAAVSLKKAMKIDPRNTLASTYLFRVLPAFEAGNLGKEGVFMLLVASEDVGLRNFDRAEKQLDSLLGKFPKFGEAYALQAELLFSTYRYGECESKLLRAEKYLPDDVDLKVRRLRCSLLRHGPNTEAARPALEEIKKLQRQHPKNLLIREILIALDQA